jgi:hypothetical protein
MQAEPIGKPECAVYAGISEPVVFSHANGYKVDIRLNPCINAYIERSFTKIGNRGDGYPQWKSAAGNIYCVRLTKLSS